MSAEPSAKPLGAEGDTETADADGGGDSAKRQKTGDGGAGEQGGTVQGCGIFEHGG